ncbi:MAG: alpha/beta hydrolase [Pseudohongiellaceae bacterium]
MDYLPAIEKEAPQDRAVDAAIVWLHGLGASGDDFAAIVPELELAQEYGIRFVFPHAPSIPVTINSGMVMPAWYDIRELDVGRHGDETQLRQSAGRVHDLIKREIARGIAPARIIVAGFSQGGAVALEAGLTFPQRLGGIMSLSGYFATVHSIAINPAQQHIPILVCHGTEDPMVAEALGRKSAERLQELGFVPEYHSYPMAHAVCIEEIRDLAGWIRRTLTG